MGTTPEDAVKQDIKATLDKYGIWHFMPMMVGYGRNGIPDHLCCISGFMFTIEAKFDAIAHRRGDVSTRGKNKGKRVKTGAPTPLQMEEMDRIRTIGNAATLVVDKGNIGSLSKFCSTLRKLEERGLLSQQTIKMVAQKLDLWYEVMPEL